MQSDSKQSENYKDRIIDTLELEPNHNMLIFSKEDEEIIRKYYPTKDTSKIAELLHKTRRQIKDKAYSMEIKKQRL